MTRLYLTLPPFASDQFEPAIEQLDHLISTLDIACINLPLIEKANSPDSASQQQQQKELVSRLQNKNIAVLADMTAARYETNRKSFEKALESARDTRCDGLHMNADGELFSRARTVLGAKAIIGVDCGASRHLAMQLGELGADYVAFAMRDKNHTEQDDHDLDKGLAEHGAEQFKPETQFEPETMLELVEWWQQLFEIPCVALPGATDRSCIEDLLELPADFITLETSTQSNLSSEPAFLAWLATQCPTAEIKS